MYSCLFILGITPMNSQGLFMMHEQKERITKSFINNRMIPRPTSRNYMEVSENWGSAKWMGMENPLNNG